MNFNPTDLSKGNEGTIKGPNGEEVKVYYLPMQGNTSFAYRRDRELERIKAEKLAGLDPDEISKMIAGGSEGFMQLNFRTSATSGEVDHAQNKAANGTLLKGWDGTEAFPDRMEDGTYHSENGEVLLSLPWFWEGLKGMCNKRADMQNVIKELVGKKSSTSSSGTKRGATKRKRSANSRKKPASSTKKDTGE